MKIGTRYISESEQLQKGLLDILDCVKSIEDMFALYDNGDFMLGGKNKYSHGISIRFPRQDLRTQNLYIAMPAYLGGRFHCAGVKWHGPNYKGVIDTPLGKAETCYTLILNDPDTGTRKAIIPANALTSYRTAAVSVCAAKYLVHGTPYVLGIYGPGKVNVLITEGILKLFSSVNLIKVRGHSEQGIIRFVDTLKRDFPDKKFVICQDVKEVVIDSDILSVNAGFDFDNIRDMPILRDSWIKGSSVILSMSFIKIPSRILFYHSHKVVDALKMYQAYIDEYGFPSYSHLSILGNSIADGIQMGKIPINEVNELSDIISGKSTIVSDGKPILFASGGLGIEDIAVGVDLLAKAEENNVGLLLDD